MTDPVRQAFHLWATTESSPVLEVGRWAWDDTLPHRVEIGAYREPSTQRAWDVWLASRAAALAEVDAWLLKRFPHSAFRGDMARALAQKEAR